MAIDIINLPDEPQPEPQPGTQAVTHGANGAAHLVPAGRNWPVYPPMPAYRAGTNIDRPDYAKGDREVMRPAAPDARLDKSPFANLRGGVR